MESPFLFFNLCSNSLSASHWLTDPPAKTILMKCTAWENRCYHWLRQVHSLSKENVDANILSNFHGKTTNKKQTANPWTPVILSIPKQRPKKKRLTDTPGASSSESWQLAGWASSKAAAGTTKRKDSSCGQSFLGYSGGMGKRFHKTVHTVSRNPGSSANFGWLKHVKKPINNGINHLSTGAGFLPSAVCWIISCWSNKIYVKYVTYRIWCLMNLTFFFGVALCILVLFSCFLHIFIRCFRHLAIVLDVPVTSV